MPLVWSKTRATAIVAACLALCAMALLVATHDTPGRAHAQASAPDNDNFAMARHMEGVLSPPGADGLPSDHSESTAGATLEAREHADCAALGATVWFAFQADRPMRLRVDSAGSDFDTVLAVYNLGGFVPSPPAGSTLQTLACDDNGLGRQSRVSVDLQPGQSVYIQAGGAGGATGTLHLHADCDPACRPRNDDVTMANGVDVYSLPYRDTKSTVAATLEAGESRPCGGIGATVWYSFISPQPLKIVVTTEGSTYDTVLAAYRQNAIVPSPPGGLAPTGCDDNGAGRQSRLVITMQAGEVLWVQAGGADGATGVLAINFDCDPACPPPNDQFNSGWYLGFPTDNLFYTKGATTEPGEPTPCGAIGRTVWLRLGVASRMRISLDMAGTDYATVAAIYETDSNDLEPTLGTLHLVRCVDHAEQSPVRFDAVANRQYAIQIGGHAGAFGALRVHADCDPSPCPPFNDDLESAYVADYPWGLPGGLGGDSRGATTQPGEPLSCGNMGKTSWFALHNYTIGTLDFTTVQSDFNTALAVYEAPKDVTSFSDLQQLKCATTTAAGLAHVSWEIQPGRVYYVQAGGENGASGQLIVQGDCTGLCPPPNDNIAAAQYIGVGGVFPRRTTGATLEPGEPQPCGPIGATVWYAVAGINGELSVSSAGSDFPVSLAVYTIDSLSPPPGSLRNFACASTSGGVATVDFSAQSDRTYYIQAGGVEGATGNLQIGVNCGPECAATGGPNTGGSGVILTGAIAGPDTGSGGYLASRQP